jgi:polyferredoxin
MVKASPPHAPARHQITVAGFLFYGFFVAVLFFGLLYNYFAPESYLGKLAATSTGRAMVLVVLLGVAVTVELALSKLGVTFVRRRDV